MMSIFEIYFLVLAVFAAALLVCYLAELVLAAIEAYKLYKMDSVEEAVYLIEKYGRRWQEHL